MEIKNGKTKYKLLRSLEEWHVEWIMMILFGKFFSDQELKTLSKCVWKKPKGPDKKDGVWHLIDKEGNEYLENKERIFRIYKDVLCIIASSLSISTRKAKYLRKAFLKDIPQLDALKIIAEKIIPYLKTNKIPRTKGLMNIIREKLNYDQKKTGQKQKSSISTPQGQFRAYKTELMDLGLRLHEKGEVTRPCELLRHSDIIFLRDKMRAAYRNVKGAKKNKPADSTLEKWALAIQKRTGRKCATGRPPKKLYEMEVR